MQDQLAVLLEPEPMAICQRSIVIVEDDPTISEVLSVRLERQGFRTCVAGCGQEGLALARAERPSLVLLARGDPHLRLLARGQGEEEAGRHQEEGAMEEIGAETRPATADSSHGVPLDVHRLEAEPAQ